LPVHQAALKVVNRATPIRGTDPTAIRISEYTLGQAALLTSVSPNFNLTDGPYIPSADIKIATFELTKLPAWNISIISKSRVHKAPDKERASDLPWGAGHTYYERSTQPYEAEQPYLPGELTPSPDIKRSYISMNLVNVIALPGEQPLAYRDLKLSLSQDGVPWSCSFNVTNDGSRSLVEPDLSGKKEVRIEINGWQWVFFMDRPRESRVIQGNQLQRAYSVTGYSRGHYMSAEYAPLRSKSISSTTAVQAATAELDGTGFSLVWDTARLPDWPMASSSFSYQGRSPMQVIKRLAEAAGAVVQASMAADELIVSPRYYPLPWNLENYVVDHTIHENQVLSLSRDWQPGKLFNAVVVTSGVDTADGVSLTVQRSGTAGDIEADEVVDEWATAYEATKARGGQILAASGVWMIYTLRLRVPEYQGAEPGLILPGETLAVVFEDSSESFRGYCTATDIDEDSKGRVSQTLTVARPYEWESN